MTKEELTYRQGKAEIIVNLPTELLTKDEVKLLNDNIDKIKQEYTHNGIYTSEDESLRGLLTIQDNGTAISLTITDRQTQEIIEEIILSI